MSCPILRKECDVEECYFSDLETNDCLVIHSLQNLSKLDEKLEQIIELLKELKK